MSYSYSSAYDAVTNGIENGKHEVEKNARISAKQSLISSHLQNYSPASNLAFNQRIKKMMASGETVYHFGFGQSPFPVIECAVKALQESAHEKDYLPVQGIPELRQTICDFHSRFDGTSLKQENVIVGPGSKELIYLLMLVFNGDILVVSPTWTTYRPQSHLSRHRSFVINTSLDGQWKISSSAIEKVFEQNDCHPNRLLILCNPCNPSGTAYSADELRELADCFRKNNIYVIADEIYGFMNYDGTHESLVKYYPEGSILSSSLSKWAGAGGWRLGYHIFPDELNELKNAVISAGTHTFSCAPSPMQYAALKVMKDIPQCEEYMKHTTRIMAVIADFCYRELTSVGVKVVKPRGGFYMLPDFEIIRPNLTRRGISTGKEMCQAILRECSVALMAGGPAFLRPSTELTVRLCFVNFDGALALKASRDIGLDVNLDDQFIQTYCQVTYDGIKALVKWVVECN
ncbi:aspartate aminotransferase-like isoform X1 [Tubulanus polymorphus]|uniref:aspartate aminotransferase-like isoform X1 n=1 Tax=Tubulanus polymorphus TaxID=672921 RepID=UPI003DA23984